MSGLRTPCLAEVIFSLGSHWGSLLPGLYSGSHARSIPVCGNGSLDQPTLCRLRHVVHLLLLARDTATGKAGTPWSREGEGHCQGRLAALKPIAAPPGFPGSWPLLPHRSWSLNCQATCSQPPGQPSLPPTGVFCHLGLPHCCQPAQPPGPASFCSCSSQSGSTY